jgi:Domain of unknown function (DUF4345)
MQEGEMATTRSDLNTARTIFYVITVVATLYGLGFLLFPQLMFALSQDPGVPANAGWVRFAGGFLIGIAVATWFAASNPEKQRALVVGLATAFALTALTLLYSTLGREYQGAQWFIWVPILINAAFSAAMWWLLAKSA